MYSYSQSDREAALIILSGRYGTNTVAICSTHAYVDQPMYPQSWVTWAAKCLRWWARYYQVLRAYAKPSGGVCFAVKAIWANLRKGMSLVAMLRGLYHVEAEPDTSTWAKPRFSREETRRNGLPIQYINPHTNKHERKMTCKSIADRLQTNV